MKTKTFIFLLTILLTAFAGCRSRKAATPGASANQQLQTIKRCNISSMSVSLNTGVRNIKLNARVQFVRDSIITVSLLPLGMEMGYVEITNDKFTIINKLTHRYAQGPLDDLKKISMLKTLLPSTGRISINAIADIILGRPVKPLFSVTRDFPPSRATAQLAGYSAVVNYRQWNTADNGALVPMATTVTVSGKETNMSADIQINKISLKSAGKFRQNATAKYLRTSVQNILDF